MRFFMKKTIKIIENIGFIIMGIVFLCVYSKDKISTAFFGLLIGIGLRGLYELMILELSKKSNKRNTIKSKPFVIASIIGFVACLASFILALINLKYITAIIFISAAVYCLNHFVVVL